MNRTKDFDCVEMKRRGARKIYEATCNMSPAEEFDYWRQRTAAARKWIEKGERDVAALDALEGAGSPRR